MHARPPLVIRLLDGKEYEFFLVHRQVVKSINHIALNGGKVDLRMIDLLGRMFYDSCLNLDGMDYEDFSSQLPGDFEKMSELYNALKEHSNAGIEIVNRPIPASPEQPTG